MKVVITRDSDGYIGFWPIEALESIHKHWGDWICSTHKKVFSVLDVKGACKILGFTPRKGKKYVKDIIVKD